MSLSRAGNAKYRPAVNAAWMAYCVQASVATSDKAEKDSWYRLELHIASKGRFTSTTEATDDDISCLVRHFSALATEVFEPVSIAGFTEAQTARFNELARAAWVAAGRDLDYVQWVDDQLVAAGILNRSGDHTHAFDGIMYRLAEIAGDTYWIAATTVANETRLRHMIREQLDELSRLEGCPVTWSYAVGIYTQSHRLPTEMSQATTRQLREVLQMLAVHVRRLQARRIQSA